VTKQRFNYGCFAKVDVVQSDSSYRQRIVDTELDELMSSLPAIAIEGAKGVGKTATAQQRAATVHLLDDPSQSEIAKGDLTRLLQGKPPVLLDEWQRVPALWDGVRRAVDRGAEPGAFLLTGSVGPRIDANAPARHSGAGRIDLLRMRPMTMAERIDSEQTVSLGRLLQADRPQLHGECETRLSDYVDEIVRSGLPGIRGLEGRARSMRLAGYLERVIDRDFPDELGRQIRKPETLRRWIQAYAAATSTTTSAVKLRQTTARRDDSPAVETTRAYQEALERLFIVDPVPGWAPTKNRLNRLNLSPKHHLVDPALSAHLLGVGTEGLLAGESPGPSVPRDGSLLGALFESLATLSIRVYAQPHDLRVQHLRMRGGVREVDLILEDRAGRVLAIEIKLAATVNDHDVRHLNWLANELGEDLLDSLVITTGREAYRRKDGIGVVPLALLGV
jgi:predicted AAA+ superfamily ATPase